MKWPPNCDIREAPKILKALPGLRRIYLIARYQDVRILLWRDSSWRFLSTTAECFSKALAQIAEEMLPNHPHPTHVARRAPRYELFRDCTGMLRSFDTFGSFFPTDKSIQPPAPLGIPSHFVSLPQSTTRKLCTDQDRLTSSTEVLTVTTLRWSITLPPLRSGRLTGGHSSAANGSVLPAD